MLLFFDENPGSPGESLEKSHILGPDISNISTALGIAGCSFHREHLMDVNFQVFPRKISSKNYGK